MAFKGRAAHAAAAPHQGINALDAMNLFFAGIACWRQQLPPGGMVHGIISQGGTAPNIIPEDTEAFFYLRSRDNATQGVLERRLDDIARGAAVMTGCEYAAVRRPNSYSADRPNPPLREAVLAAMEHFGMRPDREYRSNISTDYVMFLAVPGSTFSLTLPAANRWRCIPPNSNSSPPPMPRLLLRWRRPKSWLPSASVS